MKKLIQFFTGILILCLTGGLLYFSGALFDTSDDVNVNSIIFQPNNLSENRVDIPIPSDQMSEINLRDKLIRNFIFEYFYVLPDANNIGTRAQHNSALSMMTTSDIYNNWKKDVATDIEFMSENKIYRTATVTDEIIPNGDYLQVNYQLKTWNESNNMNYEPEITNDVMFIKISFEPGIRETYNGNNFDANKYLDSGKNPAAVFRFRVDEIQEQTK